MKHYLAYLVGFYYKPHVVIRQLKGDRKAVWYGISSILLISLLYMATSAALYFSPLKCCWMEPFVKISPDIYWLAQTVQSINTTFIFWQGWDTLTMTALLWLITIALRVRERVITICNLSTGV